MFDPAHVLADVDAHAPVDVAQTVHDLLDAGWEPVDGAAPPGTPNANLFLDLARGGDRIRIVRDRSQWMLDLHHAGWSEPFSLSTIVDVLDDRRSWPAERRGPLPEQIPPDVAWVDAVPRALAWADEAADAEPVAQDLQRRRARALFAP